MKIHLLLRTLFLCLLVTACSSKSTVKSQSLAVHKSQKAQSERVIARLLDYYEKSMDVPHPNGDISQGVVDGSGFTCLAFNEKFDIRLPRSTSQLANSGKSISRMHLQPGDLVFFKVDMGNRHVGIYVDDQKFIHASKSKGVMMSRLDSPYWHKSYWQARRVAAL